MKTVVLTGASGFVGNALNSYLTNQGFKVIPVSRKKIPGLYQVDSYFDCPAGDMLIHLAEEFDRGKVNQKGTRYKKNNLNLTSFLSKYFSGHMIYASSSVVYGDKNLNPNSEFDSVEITDVYSEIKLENEQTVIENGGTVVRLSNLFGRGMSKHNVMSDIIKQVPGVGAVKIRDTQPVRDFLYIDDLILAFSLLLRTPYNGVLNVGSGEGISIYELIRLILSLAEQSEREIIATQLSVADSINTLDISKIYEVTGWQPSFTITQYLSQLIKCGGKTNNDTT